MDNSSEGEGEMDVFNQLETLLGELGDVLHMFSNMPYSKVKDIINEGTVTVHININ